MKMRSIEIYSHRGSIIIFQPSITLGDAIFNDPRRSDQVIILSPDQIELLCQGLLDLKDEMEMGGDNE